MRVLVAGMGSAVGTNIALRVNERPEVTALAGFGLEPLRRWIPPAEFRYVHPGDGARIHEIVEDFRPDVVVHAWVFEPRARSSPGQARSRTLASTEALLGVCTKLGTVRRFVVRSSTSIYGSRRPSEGLATVHTAPRPTSTFGEIVARVENRVADAAMELGASFCPVRLAPVMASNLANPLGRFLSLPVVPTPMTTRRFGVVHLGDAVRVIAAAVVHEVEGPINVVAPEPVTPLQAVSIGRRVPMPIVPAAFRAARRVAEFTPTPLPEHVAGLLSRGHPIEASDTEALLGVPLRRTTPETIADLYSAGRVIDIDVDRLVGAG